VQQGLFEGFVDLGAQAAHVGFDYACVGLEMDAPDGFEQHGAGLHPSLVAHQMLEQAELARLQIDLLPATAHFAAHQIHLQIPRAQHRFLALHLLRPRTQPLHPIVHPIERGEKQHRRAHLRRAHRLHHRQAIEPRHHAIDDEQIIGLHRGLHQRLAPVRHVIDHMPLGLEPPAQILRRLLVILGDQDLHGFSRFFMLLPACTFFAGRPAAPRLPRLHGSATLQRDGENLTDPQGSAA